jgi:hypothetical protein
MVNAAIYPQLYFQVFSLRFHACCCWRPEPGYILFWGLECPFTQPSLIMPKFLLLLFIIAGLPALYGQTDVPDSKDHPLLTRYPGSYIASYETVKYREYTLATGPVTGYRHIEEKQTLAGSLTRITYYLDRDAEALSISEVYRDYLQAVKQAGITVLAEGHNPQASPRGAVGEGGWIGLALGANRFQQGDRKSVV